MKLFSSGAARPPYAPIITTIIDRGYVERDQKKLKPTLLGRAVDGLMLEQFPHIVDVDFSAQMEKNLDKIERDVYKRQGQIRDREVRLIGADGEQKGVVSIQVAMRAAEAVSYTHLDVYKRQMYSSSIRRTSWSMFGLPPGVFPPV